MLALLALLSITSRGVLAHAELVSSTPEAGATLDAAPATITAVFSQRLGPDGSTLSVVDATGARVDAGDARIDPGDARGRTMIVSLRSGLGAGVYTVNWTALSAADGHTSEGSFRFTVRGDTAANPSPATTGSTQSPAAQTTTQAGDQPAQALPQTGSNPTLPGWMLLALALLTAGSLVRRRAVRV